MNYLAHVLLSGDHCHWQLGGYLGDFIKGPLPPQLLDTRGAPWQDEVREGVQLHRQLDAFVETLPAYQAALQLLGPQYRRVGGIVIDVMFDHLLVHHWQRYHEQSLQAFSGRFYRVCLDNRERLPERAARFISAAAQHDLFSAYGVESTYLAVVERIAGRLRYTTNLVQAGQESLQHLPALRPLFREIMPQLQQFASEYRRRSITTG